MHAIQVAFICYPTMDTGPMMNLHHEKQLQEAPSVCDLCSSRHLALSPVEEEVASNGDAAYSFIKQSKLSGLSTRPDGAALDPL